MRRHGGRFRLKLASDEPTLPEYGSGYRVDKSMGCRLRLPAVASWEAHVAPAWDEGQVPEREFDGLLLARFESGAVRVSRHRV